MRCILMRGRRWVRQSRDVRLSVVLTVSNHLALHAHSRVMWVHLSTCTAARRHALAHFEQRIHLLIGAHLVSEDGVRAHWVVSRLVDV